MKTIKIGIVGVGNCASSLVQGLEYYRDKQPEEAVGLMHWEIGGYRPCDIEVVAAFDIDMRKAGGCQAGPAASPLCITYPRSGVLPHMRREP